MSDGTETYDQEQNVRLEKEARQFGWVPKEEFRGSEDVWVDADSFVKRGKEINPILRKNNERLLKELDSTKRQMAEFKEAADEFKQFQKESFDRRAAELNDEIQALKIQKREAISAGDGNLAGDLDDQLEVLKQRHTEETTKKPEKQQQQQVQEPTPEVTAWVEDNDWYASNSRMRAATDAIATQLSKEQPWLTGRAFFDALDTELSNTFPADKLGKRVKPRSPTEGSSTSSSRSGGSQKTYSSLPADAKVACDKFVKQGLMTKEEYVSSYEW